MLRTPKLPRSVGAIVSLGVGIAVAMPGVAQDQTRTAEPAQAMSAELTIIEVTVTAQRRVERLQEVPISAQVIGQQALAEQNLNSLADLSHIAPSVHIGDSGRSNNLYIRGIGSGENQSFDQSVSTFIDDVYHGRSRISAATFLDVDRVELLKGPQSTYFGNNAIAGALNIISRAPSRRFEAWSRALYSPDGEQYALEGGIGGPVGEHFAARAAVTYNGMDGWLENVSLREQAPHTRNLAGRMSLLFAPSDDLDVTLKIEGGSNEVQGSLPLHIINCPPPPPFTASGFCAAALGLGLPQGLDDNRNAENGGEAAKLEIAEEVLTINYHRWNHQLTSVTAYYDYDYRINIDTDGTPVPLLHAQVPESYRQFSQELRLISATDQPLEYLVGLYYQSGDLATRQDLAFFVLSPVIAGAPPLAPLVPYLPLGQSIDFAQDESNYSVFGSLTWNVTESLKLTGGLRGSRVEKSYDWNLFYGTATQDFGGVVALPNGFAPLAGALGLGTAGTLDGERSDEAWLPSANLTYDLGASVMVYASYARGFKAGGFNAADNTGDAANQPYEPEYVHAYEAGIKSELWDRSVLLNLSLFHSDYSDLQVGVNNATSAGIVSVVRNAASSVSEGVELETQWAITPHLRLAANATYLDAHYVSYPNVGPTQLQQLNGLAFQDLSGEPTMFAPEWSGRITGTYSATLPGDYRLTAEVSPFYSSAYFVVFSNDPLQRQSAYWRWDARLSLESADGRWGFDLIGKNLNDENIIVFASDYPLSLGSALQQKQQPRNIAAQVRFRW